MAALIDALDWVYKSLTLTDWTIVIGPVLQEFSSSIFIRFDSLDGVLLNIDVSLARYIVRSRRTVTLSPY